MFLDVIELEVGWRLFVVILWVSFLLVGASVSTKRRNDG